MMRILHLITLLALLTGLCPAAVAQARCTVTDPTGTPLNIRDTPNGKVIGQAANGAVMAIVDLTRDERGRPWAFVRPSGSSHAIGWVFREFISCR